MKVQYSMDLNKYSTELNIPWYKYGKEFGNFTWNYGINRFLGKAYRYKWQKGATKDEVRNYIDQLIEHDLKRLLLKSGLYKEDRWSELLDLNKEHLENLRNLVIDYLYDDDEDMNN